MDSELARSIRALKKIRNARRLLPTEVDDLTYSHFRIIVSALPSESWHRVMDELQLLETCR